jgi:hypothetical protein
MQEAGGSGGRVRVRPGARQRPARDPRSWRRSRMTESATAATRADVADMEMPRVVAVADDPRDRYAFPQEFPDGPYGMAEDAPPHEHSLGGGQRAIGREADQFPYSAYPYDRDYGAVTGTVAPEPPPTEGAEAASALPPASGDEPSD